MAVWIAGLPSKYQFQSPLWASGSIGISGFVGTKMGPTEECTVA